MSLKRWAAGVSAGMLVVLASAGCGGSKNAAPDPTPSVTATTAPVTASPSPSLVVPSPGGPVPTVMVKPTGVLTPEQEAVLQGYQAWWQQCMPAADRDPEHAVEHLRKCGTQDAAERQGKGIQKMQADGFIGFGAPILHPQPPVIETDNFAVVRDCQDNRNYGQVRASEGETGAVGPEHASYESALIKENGVWKVAGGNEPKSGNTEEYCS